MWLLIDVKKKIMIYEIKIVLDWILIIFNWFLIFVVFKEESYIGDIINLERNLINDFIVCFVD